MTVVDELKKDKWMAFYACTPAGLMNEASRVGRVGWDWILWA